MPAARKHCSLEGLLGKAWPLGQPLLQAELRAIVDKEEPQAFAPQRAPEPEGGAAAAAAAACEDVQGGREEGGVREGVLPPGALRAKLAQGQKPKWLKL